MSEDTRNTPTTVRELGIKFQGFQELVDERLKNQTNSIERLAKALEESNQNKADKADLDALVLRVVALEVLMRKKPWVLVGLSSIFTVVITLVVSYVVNDLISGGK